jgi:hypothetical protein
MLRHEADGFTFPAMESVLRIYIALEDPSPRSGLAPPTLGPMASMVKKNTTEATDKIIVLQILIFFAINRNL